MQIHWDRAGSSGARLYRGNRQDSLTGLYVRPYFSQGLSVLFEIAAVDSSIFYNDAGRGFAGPRNERKEPDPTAGQRALSNVIIVNLPYGNDVNKAASACSGRAPFEPAQK